MGLLDLDPLLIRGRGVCEVAEQRGVEEEFLHLFRDVDGATLVLGKEGEHRTHLERIPQGVRGVVRRVQRRDRGGGNVIHPLAGGQIFQVLLAQQAPCRDTQHGDQQPLNAAVLGSMSVEYVAGGIPQDGLKVRRGGDAGSTRFPRVRFQSSVNT